MKKLLIPVLVLLSIACYAQEDTTKTNPIVASLSIANKNFWRGNVYGDNTPTLSGTLGYHFKTNTEIGVTGTSPINGTRTGYGIWMEAYISQSIGNFTLTIDDYYFFNAYDSLNDYFNWNSSETQHLVEGRVKYDGGRFNATASYVLYAANSSVNSLYLEAEYYLISESLSLSAGAVLGESYLNFFDDGGLAFVGVTGYRDIKVSESYSIPFRVSLMASPNYENASKYPGFTQNPINLIVGLTF